MEDEKDLSVDNNSDINDGDVNNEEPETQQNDLNNESIGNGYNGLASSNREAFARGLNDNYNDRIARNRANLEAARARSNNPYREKRDLDDNSSDEDELKNKNFLDKAGDKANVLKNKASLLSSQIDNVRSKAFMVSNPTEAAKMVIKKKIMAWIIPILLAAIPYVLAIFVVFVVVLAIIGSLQDEGVISGGIYDYGDFNISTTLLSQEEFRAQLKSAVNKYPELEIFANNANDIYDIALSENVNPELVVIRAISEGFSPGTGNNFWGINCTNTGGGRDCESYDTFSIGVRAFVGIVSRYSDLTELMSHYSYIGDYWYNPGSSSVGGCYYASHIYAEIPGRVQEACTRTCSVGNTSNCVATTEEDQQAYANWQVNKMAQIRADVFNIQVGDNSSDVLISDDSVIMLSDAEAWYLLTGYESKNKANLLVTKKSMDSRMVEIIVPIRVWSSADTNDYSTKQAEARVTVNKALANLYYNFFKDIYNEATDFVINPSEIYCYSFRQKTGGGRLSAHSYGAACDVNWSTTGNGYNAHVYTKDEWNRLRKSKSKYQIIYKDSKVAEIAHRYTLSWGGEWTSVTDAMHFSFIADVDRATLQSRHKS